MLNLTMREDMGGSLQKGLSDWWSEESAYLIQRIERWAAFTRGYNRLRSVRLSKARMTMQTDKLTENNCWLNSSSNIYSLKHPHSPDETGRINCCGTFNYQSNSHFNSTCLETYRYDHSIYFKTIGDIKNSKKRLRNNDDGIHYCRENGKNSQQCRRCSCLNDSQFKLNIRVNSESFDTPEDLDDIEINVITPNGDVRWDHLYNNNPKRSDDIDTGKMLNHSWPIVELTMLNENVLNLQEHHQDQFYENNIQNDDGDDNNNDNNNNNDINSNNNDNNNNCDTNDKVQYDNNNASTSCRNEGRVKNDEDHHGLAKLLNFRKVKKSSKIVPHTISVLNNDDNIWPSVTIGCGTDIESSSMPVSHQHSIKVK